MTTLIALLGPAGAGKSTIAQHLVDYYGATKYAFAGPLKELAMHTLGFTHEQCWGSQQQKEEIDPRYGFSPRWFLQKLGTEGCRQTFGENFWSDQLLAKIKRENPAVAVIEDCRFISEAKAIRGWGGVVNGSVNRGYIWRLEAPERETNADPSHASEAEWSKAPYDFVIAPRERGIPALLLLADDAARHAKLFPKRVESAL